MVGIIDITIDSGVGIISMILRYESIFKKNDLNITTNIHYTCYSLCFFYLFYNNVIEWFFIMISNKHIVSIFNTHLTTFNLNNLYPRNIQWYMQVPVI